jgi:hypothetical protein
MHLSARSIAAICCNPYNWIMRSTADHPAFCVQQIHGKNMDSMIKAWPPRGRGAGFVPAFRRR